MKICPNCKSCILKVRTDRPDWAEWIRCEVCGYMEKTQKPEEKTNEKICNN